MNKLVPYIVLVILYVRGIQSQNCVFDPLTIPISPPRVIFRYECTAGVDNPIFPVTGSGPNEFNELDLSPNLYTSVPSRTCLFNNTYLVDMSFNKLKNLTSIFSALKCLQYLKTLNFSNNFISTPIVASDFDDSFGPVLESLDLSSNQIPSIASDVFLTKTNTVRMKSLKLLNLANNRLKEFDILWPLLLPHANLRVNLNKNMISSLVNPQKKSYSDALFANAMDNNRVVSVQDNLLSTFDDSNLLQYGISSSTDLLLFIRKILNYDFTQTDKSTKFICTCPTSGLRVVSWFREQISNFDFTKPIMQTYCINSTTKAFIWNTNCLYNPSLTTTLNADVTTPSTGQQVSDSNYGFLAFLIIPVIIIVIVVLMCCCGRSINSALISKYNTVCCPRCWPGKGKEYDAVICYNQSDEKWVKKELKNTLTNLNKQFKIHLMTSYGKQVPFSKPEQKQFFTKTKRIFLVVTENFINEEFSDEDFRKHLESICNDDKECIIVLINISGAAMEDKVRKIEFDIEDDEEDCTCCGKNLSMHFNKMFLLSDVEVLNIDKKASFAKDITFYMPIGKPDGAPTFDDSDNLIPKTRKLPKLPKKQTSDSESTAIVVNVTHDKPPKPKRNMKIESDASSMDLLDEIDRKRSQKKTKASTRTSDIDIYKKVRRDSLSKKDEDSRTMVSEDLHFANFNEQVLKKIPLQTKSSLNTIEIINSNNNNVDYDIADLIKPLPLTDDLTLVLPKSMNQ